MVRVPTDVSEEETTVDFNTVPDRVLASAVTVMAVEPSKLTPFIALVVASLVAVAAFPVVL